MAGVGSDLGASNEPIVEMFGQVIRCGCDLPPDADRGPVHGRDLSGALLPCPNGIAVGEPRLLSTTADGSLSIERRP